MTQLTKLEERLRKEGLPHVMYQTIIATERKVGGLFFDTTATVLAYPNSRDPIVSFIERTDEPGVLKMGFGAGDVTTFSRTCRDIYQAHDIIIGLFTALNS